MEYLVYRSEALVTPESPECQSIVTISHLKNTLAGITGFLHAEDGVFIQYIEGPAEPLWQLYNRLHSDDRHRNLELLGHGVISRPRFKKWRLGYSQTEIASFRDFMGEVSAEKSLKDASCAEAVYFLMGASVRIDLGIGSSL
ncbi:Sensors of blue-light using FAD [Loktanella atrilutea]|uniref:Sensors of blue-light using FAD n=1 Tax=Loktanella atrilutea TaxID=366533 RepID=A0A1M4SUY8_LOKAT|nr:BLUF domain-containing protein [Loktanella atrilutea]SHE36010.1 Sensors of blue-light using FAD [Loktanella atrilutea]